MTSAEPTGDQGSGQTVRRARGARRIAVTLGVLSLVALLGAVAVIVALAVRPQANAEASAEQAARRFLHDYVDPDGRVVRRDQGGDSVSEGQAYAMLLAVAVDDEPTFQRVWAWTSSRLQRPDGLLSWRWADGRVLDTNTAADADLDAARALVLAGRRFIDPALLAAGLRMASAILAVETMPIPAAPVPGGRALTAGSWVTQFPASINPSYFNPRAEQLLGAASGDQRWFALTATHRWIVRRLIGSGSLPPDWATIEASGKLRLKSDPDGNSSRFGLDAPRLIIRMAESCNPADRAMVARLLPTLHRRGADVRAEYDLRGRPLVSWAHPLSYAAVAAAVMASGRPGREATAWMSRAARLDANSPNYYGAAWTALTEVMLQTDLLGSCTNPDGDIGDDIFSGRSL